MRKVILILMLFASTNSQAQLNDLLRSLKEQSTEAIKPATPKLDSLPSSVSANSKPEPLPASSTDASSKGFAYVNRPNRNVPVDCSSSIDDPSKTKSQTFQPRTQLPSPSTKSFRTFNGDGDKSKIDSQGNLLGTIVRNIPQVTLMGNRIPKHNLIVMNHPDWSLGGVDMNIDIAHISNQQCTHVSIENGDRDDMVNIVISCNDENASAYRQLRFVRNNRNGTMILEGQTYRTCGPKQLKPNSEFYKQLTSRFACHEKQRLDERSGTFDVLVFKNSSNGELLKVYATDDTDVEFPKCGSSGLVDFDLSNPDNNSRFNLVNEVMDSANSSRTTSRF